MAAIDALRQAKNEGLTLLTCPSMVSGYHGVLVDRNTPGLRNKFRVQVRRDGKRLTLGRFGTAEEAALCFARSPEGRKIRDGLKGAIERHLPGTEAKAIAKKEGLKLLTADNTSGYKNVACDGYGYRPWVRRQGREVVLGRFHTPEAAALAYARTAEAQADAKDKKMSKRPSVHGAHGHEKKKRRRRKNENYNKKNMGAEPKLVAMAAAPHACTLATAEQAPLEDEMSETGALDHGWPSATTVVRKLPPPATSPPAKVCVIAPHRLAKEAPATSVQHHAQICDSPTAVPTSSEEDFWEDLDNVCWLLGLDELSPIKAVVSGGDARH